MPKKNDYKERDKKVEHVDDEYYNKTIPDVLAQLRTSESGLSSKEVTARIRNYGKNLMTEIIGTAMLLIGVLGIFNANNGIGSGFGPYAVGILVFSIGLSLGGPTGYAINPARDLGPRIAHQLLPIPGKRDSDWGYSWVPIVGPLIGGALGSVLYQFVFLPFWGG